MSRISGCNDLSAEEKESLNEAYRRAIHHTTLNEAGVNASAQVGGSQLNVNSATLVPNKSHHHFANPCAITDTRSSTDPDRATKTLFAHLLG